MKTLLFCMAGGVACLVLIFLAILKVGSREDRYREAMARKAEEDIKKMNTKLNTWAYRSALEKVNK